MKITRRTFVKGLCAAVALSAGGVNALELVNIRKVVYGEFGNTIPLTGSLHGKPDAMGRIVKDILIPDARKTVGKNVVIEIRVSIPSQYGKPKGIVWYTNEKISRRGIVEGLREPKAVGGGNFYYCGRVLT